MGQDLSCRPEPSSSLSSRSFCNISLLGSLNMDLRNIQKTLPVITIGYVLKLENDKYYVGISGNINHRIAQHIAGEASRWSKLHKVISVQSVEVVPNEYGKWEKQKTLELMDTYGWSNVRGGPFCKVKMSYPPSELSKHE